MNMPSNRRLPVRLTPEIEEAIESAGLQDDETLPTKSAPSRRRRGSRFVWTLPYDHFVLAASLPGKSLAVWVLVHHRTRLTGANPITIPSDTLTICGISRETYRRARRHLERAGLILAHDPGPGCSTLIELIDPQGDGAEDS